MMTYIIYQTIQSSSRRTFLNRLFHENNAVELKLNYRPSGNWRAECITKCRVYNLQLYKDLIIGHSNEQFELKFLVIRLYIFLLLFNSIISILMIKVYNIYIHNCVHLYDLYTAPILFQHWWVPWRSARRSSCPRWRVSWPTKLASNLRRS